VSLFSYERRRNNYLAEASGCPDQLHGYLVRPLIDEVRFEEGRVVVHMKKDMGENAAHDAGKKSLE